MDVKHIAKQYISFVLKANACEDLVSFILKSDKQCNQNNENNKNTESITGYHVDVYQDMATHFRVQATKKAEILGLQITLPVEEFCVWLLAEHNIRINPDDADNIYY